MIAASLPVARDTRITARARWLVSEKNICAPGVAGREASDVRIEA